MRIKHSDGFRLVLSDRSTSTLCCCTFLNKIHILLKLRTFCRRIRAEGKPKTFRNFGIRNPKIRKSEKVFGIRKSENPKIRKCFRNPENRKNVLFIFRRRKTWLVLCERYNDLNFYFQTWFCQKVRSFKKICILFRKVQQQKVEVFLNVKCTQKKLKIHQFSTKFLSHTHRKRSKSINFRQNSLVMHTEKAQNPSIFDKIP